MAGKAAGNRRVPAVAAEKAVTGGGCALLGLHADEAARGRVRSLQTKNAVLSTPFENGGESQKVARGRENRVAGGIRERASFVDAVKKRVVSFFPGMEDAKVALLGKKLLQSAVREKAREKRKEKETERQHRDVQGVDAEEGLEIREGGLLHRPLVRVYVHGPWIRCVALDEKSDFIRSRQKRGERMKRDENVLALLIDREVLSYERTGLGRYEKGKIRGKKIGTAVEGESHLDLRADRRVKVMFGRAQSLLQRVDRRDDADEGEDETRPEQQAAQKAQQAHRRRKCGLASYRVRHERNVRRYKGKKSAYILGMERQIASSRFLG